MGLSQQTNKLQCVYLAFKNPKQAVLKVNRGEEGKSKLPMMFFEVKMHPEKCR